MKKMFWLFVVVMFCASLTMVGCSSDDVEKDRITASEIPKLEDVITK